MTECLRWAGPLPPQTRVCRVPCKDDCALTAWSKFSDCAGCGSSRSRKRSLTGRDSIFIHRLWDTASCFTFTVLGQAVSLWFPISKKHLMLHSVCCLCCSIPPTCHYHKFYLSGNINESVHSFQKGTTFLHLQGYCHRNVFFMCWKAPVLWHIYQNRDQPLFSHSGSVTVTSYGPCSVISGIKLGLSQLVIPYFSAHRKI